MVIDQVVHAFDIYIRLVKCTDGSDTGQCRVEGLEYRGFGVAFKALDFACSSEISKSIV